MALQIMRRMISRGVRHIINHKVSTLLILMLTIALIFLSTAKFSEPQGALASQKVSSAPPSTEMYFKGQTDFDSTLIWESLSPDLIRKAELSGATKDDLQQQLDQARDLGRQVEEIAYIGGHELQDGRTMQFYVVTIRPSTTETVPDEIFYVFTLDTSGKIESIE